MNCKSQGKVIFPDFPAQFSHFTAASTKKYLEIHAVLSQLQNPVAFFIISKNISRMLREHKTFLGQNINSFSFS